MSPWYTKVESVYKNVIPQTLNELEVILRTCFTVTIILTKSKRVYKLNDYIAMKFKKNDIYNWSGTRAGWDG